MRKENLAAGFSRRTVLIGGTVLAATSAIGGTSAHAAAPVAVTDKGVVRGSTEDGLTIWRGIRYAAPPIGPNRWRPPRPLASWQGVRDAITFGPACLQPIARNEPERSLKDMPQSEDCLTLNVWAPQGGNDLPVMVWIHGGSFRFGAGSLELYHGVRLARRGVVVVTINYRLGLFGTFSHPALREQGEEDVNFGLLDQIAALEWVRDNIASFGGNPANVTLSGESAGGVSVSYLMTSPLARGLFHRAIVQSGGLAVPLHGRPQADAIGHRLSADLGLPAASAQDLRALPATALRDAPYTAADIMPKRDNRLIHRPLAEAFAEGEGGDIPLMIGWNTAEAGFFGRRYWESIQEDLGPELFGHLKALCTGWGKDSDDAAAEQIASEWFAGSVSRRMALLHRGPVHAYRFGWVPQAERATSLGAIHTAEIPYVFGHVAVAATADAESRAVSNSLAARWAAFVSNGEPQEPDALGWSRQSGDGSAFLLIGTDGVKIGPDPCAALDEAILNEALPPRP